MGPYYRPVTYYSILPIPSKLFNYCNPNSCLPLLNPFCVVDYFLCSNFINYPSFFHTHRNIMNKNFLVAFAHNFYQFQELKR